LDDFKTKTLGDTD